MDVELFLIYIYFIQFVQVFNMYMYNTATVNKLAYRGLILGLRPANERRRYKVTASLIGWAQT